MGHIILPYSGVELEIPDNVSYTSVGRVDDVDDFYKKLCQENNMIIDEEEIVRKNDNNVRICAKLFPLETRVDGRLASIHYFAVSEYSEWGPFVKNMGHEEGHFLLKMGGSNLMKDYIHGAGIRPKGFWKMGEEVKCELFGISTLAKRVGGKGKARLQYDKRVKEKVRRHLVKYSSITID